MSKFNNMQRNPAFLAAALIPVLLVGTLTAGDLNPPAPPTDPTSAMYNLADLYNRLNAGTPGAKRTSAFTEPVSAPGSTMHTLNEIMNKAPAVDALGATADQVLAGKKYWGLNLSQWGTQSGTMSNIGAQQIIPGVATQTINQGYHDGAGAVTGDAGLVGANIKSGATIFGVPGDANVVDTSSGDAVAGELFNGKKAWVDGSEITGTLQTRTLSAATTTVEAGNYVETSLSVVDPDLVSGNIKAGTAIFGVTGDTNVVDTSSGDAVPGELFNGKKAWVDGSEITGTVQTRTLSAATTTVEAGNYVATSLLFVDPDLVSGNIKAGTTIFGVTGDSKVADTSTGNALESQIAAGAKAWVNGQLVTGRLSGGTYVASTTGTWSAGGRWCNRGDGTVVDTYSGLIWDQQGTFASGSFYTVQALCTDHWRLPTLGELETAVSMWQAPEYVTTNLSTQGIFANITTNWVWTSTRIINPSYPDLVVYQTVKLDNHDGGAVYPNLNNTMPQLATYTGMFVWRVRSAW